MRTTTEASKSCGSPVRIRETASTPPADATRAMIGWSRGVPAGMSETAIRHPGYWKRLGAWDTMGGAVLTGAAYPIRLVRLPRRLVWVTRWHAPWKEPRSRTGEHLRCGG